MIPLLGGTVTSVSRHVSHWINFVVDIIMLGFVTSFLVYEAHTKRKPRFAPNDANDDNKDSNDTTTDRQIRRRHWLIYGPVYLVLLGSILILIDPIRHILQDQHLIDPRKSSMYIHGCPIRSPQLPEKSCRVSEDCGSHDCGGGYYSVHPGEDCFTCYDGLQCSEGTETFRCLSLVGWLITVVCTYVGFTLFFVGVIWNSNLHNKIATQWKVLRSTSSNTASSSGEEGSAE